MSYSIRELWTHDASLRADARAELMRERAGPCEPLSDMDVASKWIEEVATGLISGESFRWLLDSLPGAAGYGLLLYREEFPNIWMEITEDLQAEQIAVFCEHQDEQVRRAGELLAAELRGATQDLSAELEWLHEAGMTVLWSRADPTGATVLHADPTSSRIALRFGNGTRWYDRPLPLFELLTLCRAYALLPEGEELNDDDFAWVPLYLTAESYATLWPVVFRALCTDELDYRNVAHVLGSGGCIQREVEWALDMRAGQLFPTLTREQWMELLADPDNGTRMASMRLYARFGGATPQIASN